MGVLLLSNARPYSTGFAPRWLVTTKTVPGVVGVNGIVWSGSANVVFLCQRGVIYRVETNANNVQASFDLSTGGTAAKLGHQMERLYFDGTHVYALDPGLPGVRVFNQALTAEAGVLDTWPAIPQSFAFRADGKFLVSTVDGDIHRFSAAYAYEATTSVGGPVDLSCPAGSSYVFCAPTTGSNIVVVLDPTLQPVLAYEGSEFSTPIALQSVTAPGLPNAGTMLSASKGTGYVSAQDLSTRTVALSAGHIVSTPVDAKIWGSTFLLVSDRLTDSIVYYDLNAVWFSSVAVGVSPAQIAIAPTKAWVANTEEPSYSILT